MEEIAKLTLQSLNQQLRVGAKDALQAEQAEALKNAHASSFEAKQAAEQFEALLMQQMMKSMWSGINIKGSLLGSSEEATYRDMYNQFLADEISKGEGIGIKEAILPELTKKKS
jgi:Rod binding domain-containing protein